MCQTNQICCVQIKYGTVCRCLWLRSVSLLALMLDGEEKVDQKHMTRRIQIKKNAVAIWFKVVLEHGLMTVLMKNTQQSCIFSSQFDLCLFSHTRHTNLIHLYLSIFYLTETKNGNICLKQAKEIKTARDHISGKSDTCC